MLGLVEKVSLGVACQMSTLVVPAEDDPYLPYTQNGMAIKAAGNIFELMKETLEGEKGGRWDIIWRWYQ